MGLESKVLIDVEAYARQILEHELPNHLSYHNINHTSYVVSQAKHIAEQSGLAEADMELLLIAAWFHDLGYKIQSQGHEDQSKKIAQEFLESQKFDPEKTQKVLDCIEATRLPQQPKDLLGKILSDADLAHLAADDFFERCQPLREEWDYARNRPLSDLEWLQINRDFMLSHQYFTEYGKAVLEPAKQNNLKEVKKKLKKLKKKQTEHLSTRLGIPEEEVRNLQKKLKKVEGRPERGIETVFRITSRNHLDLSSMADSKANIMISVNTIIISVIISILLNQLDTQQHLILPTVTLLTTCLLTIILAILATRPNISSGKFTRMDVEQRNTNLLFFGNFHKMKLEDYEWGMRELLDDSEYLYSSLIRDIYFLGIVLGKKYRLLRSCYTVFMFGLIISILAFIFSILLKKYPQGI